MSSKSNIHGPNLSQEQASKTALVVFSRDVSDEAHSKAIWKDQQSNLQLFQTLIRHTKRLASQTKLPLLWMGSKAQVGASFSERITNAFKNAFAQGYQSVILIGNDCPAMSAADIRKAYDSLAAGEVVLGPSKDGGLWLIGLTAAHFEQLTLADLPWKSSDLYGAFASDLRSKKISLNKLEQLTDIDKIGDLNSVLAELAADSAIRNSLLLLVQLASKLATFEQTTAAPVLWTAPAHALRGPPIGC